MKLRVILMLVLLAAVGGGFGAYQMIRWGESPILSESDHPPPHIIVIAPGSTFQQVASLLEKTGLIRSRSVFLWMGRAQEAERKIQPGEYELHAAMAPADILSKLLAGRVVLHSVTIPEGYTINQIADVLAEQGITDRSEFIRLAHDTQFIKTLGVRSESIEGYLYPDTYRFPRAMAGKDVMKAMVDQLGHVLSAEWKDRARELRLTMHEVLTLASVIEKETGAADERPHISSVFHNRLKKRIPLQSDPTVIYGLPAFDGNLRKKDLSHPSPYNTYRWAGLPPGPIASPGAESIRAALYPAATPDLYFVSKNDGTHYFSATLIQHNKAVEIYQKQPFRHGNQSETSMFSRKARSAAQS